MSTVKGPLLRLILTVAHMRFHVNLEEGGKWGVHGTMLLLFVLAASPFLPQSVRSWHAPCIDMKLI